MRADRLLALLLVLRHRARATAGELAAELEVSERTVLRDMEALSAAGVPVYAERGRGGGFSLLPGWTTDLSGLSGDEARALLVAGASTAGGLGLGAAFSSGLAKVLSSLPAEQRRAAGDSAARILVVEQDFLGRAPAVGPELAVLQRAVTAGRRVELGYRDRSGRPGRRTLDPDGLICADGTWYLLARHRGARRTYRVDRTSDPAVLPEPVLDPVSAAELPAWWEESRAGFLATIPATGVRLLVDVGDEAVLHALAERARGFEEPPARVADGVAATVRFAGPGHAVGVLWSELHRVAVLAPDDVALLLRDRLARAAARQG